MDSQNNINTNNILRWVSGLAQAIIVPMLFGLASSLNTVKESSIRMEGRFDVQDMRLQEMQHVQERTEKRLEYLEQLNRQQRK